MASSKAIICVATMAVLFQLAKSKSFTIGSPNGSWDQNTDLQAWASAQTFRAGDTLIFKYTSAHNVLEVSKADYDACRANNPEQSLTGGNTIINLTSSGKRFFVCGIPGHCSSGMKVEIDAVAAAVATPPTAAPPKTTASPPPKSHSSPPKQHPPIVAPSEPPTSPILPPSGPSELPPLPLPPMAAPGSGKNSAANEVILHGKAAIGIGIGMLMIFTF